MSKDSERGKYTSPEGSATWEYLATMSCSLVMFCLGCVIGWISPALPLLMDPDSPNALTSSEASTVSSIIGVGQAIAPTLIVVMADKLGRKNSILAASIPTILSWGLIILTENFMVLLISRFCGGLSFGLLLNISPMYLGEIASLKLRGAIGMVCCVLLNAGVLFIFVIVPYFSIQKTACICLSIATIAVISIWFIPESPYFFAMVGRIDEAENALVKLRGKTDVSEELDLIEMTVSQQGNDTEVSKPKSSALNQLFTVPGNRTALYINLLFSAVMQFGGYITIMTYVDIIFAKMKTAISGHVCIMITAILQLVSTVLAAFFVDKFGRKPLVCISGVISGVCLLAVAVYFYLMEYTDTDVTPYAMYATCAIFLNVVVLNIGLAPLQLVIQAETFDTHIKGLATCIVGSSGGVFAIIGVKSYLMFAETWNYGHSLGFFSFAALTWISTALILKLLPETKGKTFLEIQRDLNA